MTYGLVSIIGISIPASLAGYRNYDKKITLDFTPLNSILDVKYSQCGSPASFWIQYYKPFYRKLKINVTSSQEDFSTCLFGPLKEGFRPVCQESFHGQFHRRPFVYLSIDLSISHMHARVNLSVLPCSFSKLYFYHSPLVFLSHCSHPCVQMGLVLWMARDRSSKDRIGCAGIWREMDLHPM